MNITDILTKTGQRLPDKVAFYFADQGTTYQTLQDLTESFAFGLQKMGVQKSDRVAVFTPSSLEFIISWFAAVKLGAIVVPVNIMLKARESRYILENAQVSTLIVHQSQVEMIDSLRQGLPFLKNLVVIGKQPAAGSRLFADLLHTHPAVLEAAVIGIPDPKRGESPMAFVILKPGQKGSEEELIQFCKENLAAYKVIKAVRFVEEFPRNPNRKVLKRELREMVSAIAESKG